MSTNVLIVDDSAVMRDMIRRAIAMAGLDVAEVYEAANGIEAYAQLAEHAIGVVILDINMPVMNGLQFLERISDDERLKDIPVVVASTASSEPRIEQMVANGARGFVRKPFHPEQLRDVLAPLTGVQAAPAGAGDSAGEF